VFCKACGNVKQEKLDFMSSNPFYTKRFAEYVGKRCRTATIKDIAKELMLDWHTVKNLEKEYMAGLLRKVGTPAPEMIGVDEIAIRRGHIYRIVVSDLLRRRPIWFGGIDRSTESMDAFYEWLGPKKCRKIRLAVMDMWKPFAKSLKKEGHAPHASILFDKFHVMSHLGVALDKVRKSEYRRLSGKDRAFIKGQRYTLLSNAENLTNEGRSSLKKLLAANKRLNAAYLLKESFDRLWTYQRESWMRRFFDNWRASLKWQRLKPFEAFADMVERNWEGLVEYTRLKKKPPLGFVEGLNTKIRVIHRRAYGLRDEEYLRLKILTCMLPVS
jgi:transposase